MTEQEESFVDGLISQHQAKDEALTAAGFIISEQQDRIRDLEQQHRALVLRNRLLRDRHDLPIERLVAYEDIVALFDEQALELATLRARVRALGLDEEAGDEDCP